LDYLNKSFNGSYNNDALNIIINNITGTRPSDLHNFVKINNLRHAIQQFNESHTWTLQAMYYYLVEQNLLSLEKNTTVDIMQRYMSQYLDPNGCITNDVPIPLMNYLQENHMFKLHELECLWNGVLVNILRGNTINGKVYDDIMKAQQNSNKQNQNHGHKTETISKKNRNLIKIYDFFLYDHEDNKENILFNFIFLIIVTFIFMIAVVFTCNYKIFIEI